jgi:hypothetical protein
LVVGSDFHCFKKKKLTPNGKRKWAINCGYWRKWTINCGRGKPNILWLHTVNIFSLSLIYNVGLIFFHVSFCLAFDDDW